MVLFFYVLLAGFLVEGITQLVQKSVFFSPVREFFELKSNYKLCRFFNTVLGCPYCTSVWVSMFVTVLILASEIRLVLFGTLVIDYFLFFLVCHRVSNLIHDLWDRYFTRHYI